MDDFIDKAAWGLNAIFSSGDGFPRTCFLFCGGITDEKAYKRFLPTRQVQSRVWYSAYPHLTTKNIANNAAIRQGLSGHLSADDTKAWLRAVRRRATSCRNPASSRESSTAFHGTGCAALQVDDIQGILLYGYGRLRHACFLLLGITEAAAAKAWLSTLDVRNAQLQARRDRTVRQHRVHARRPETARASLTIDRRVARASSVRAWPGPSTGSESSATSARAVRTDGAGAGLRNPRAAHPAHALRARRSGAVGAAAASNRRLCERRRCS